MRLFKVPGSDCWYVALHVGGRRQRKSTRCTDKRAAEAVARQWERDAADPDHAAARGTTLGEVLADLLKEANAEAKSGKRSAETADFYRKKCGHWTRLLETTPGGKYEPFPLASLRASHVDDYIDRRRAEGTADTTIDKELGALRRALKLAKRRGKWRGDVDAILPARFGGGYKPRERALTPHELHKLLGELTPDRAARVAFIVATSANWAESEHARREDLPRASEAARILVRGTKRATRHRVVPLVAPWQRGLLEHAAKHAEGQDGDLFATWGNVGRDLPRACERAGIPRCTPNDLRRTFGVWMRASGVQPATIAPMMGHADSRMVERVYGRLPVDLLARRVAGELGLALPDVCHTPAEGPDAWDRLNSAETKKPRRKPGFQVPRDRIELPTRGFSIPVQMWPTPREHLGNHKPGRRARPHFGQSRAPRPS